MAGTDAVLELDALSVAYDKSPVVRDLTLTVGAGEVVALLGANGAGKTTTLGAISGLLKPSAGAVRLNGADLAGVAPTARARLGIAHVPHDRGIFFGLTVAEHFRLDGIGAPADLDVAFDHFPALRPLRTRKAGLLSGGEQQMLAIARALMSRPRLLMLDEPSLGLAPMALARIYDRLTAIRSRGAAILVAEQNAARAFAVADRVLIMSRGSFSLSGRPDQIKAHRDFDGAYFGVAMTGASFF